jgi:hypothetical protein
VTEIAEQECDYRPYRLENESKEDYRRALGAAVPTGPFAVDLVPDLRALSEFVTTLTTARLTNLDRDALEVEYRKGIWDDAWDGFFYYPALLISHVLAYDARLTDVGEFAGSLPIFELMCERVESEAKLSRLEARGTVRLLLKDVGLDPQQVTKDAAILAVDRFLEHALRVRRVPDANQVKSRVLQALRETTLEGPRVRIPKRSSAASRCGVSASHALIRGRGGRRPRADARARIIRGRRRDRVEPLQPTGPQRAL